MLHQRLKQRLVQQPPQKGPSWSARPQLVSHEAMDLWMFIPTRYAKNGQNMVYRVFLDYVDDDHPFHHGNPNTMMGT
jgi:hypothetical protein